MALLLLHPSLIGKDIIRYGFTQQFVDSPKASIFFRARSKLVKLGLANHPKTQTPASPPSTTSTASPPPELRSTGPERPRHTDKRGITLVGSLRSREEPKFSG
jgi:hypothetical protein